MLVLKKTSRLGKATLARTGTVVVQPKRDPIEVGHWVKILAGDHTGDIGQVKWAGEAKDQERVGVAIPKVDELVFVNVEHVTEVQP